MEEDRIIDLGKIGLTFDPDAWDAEKPYEKYTVIMHEGRGWVSLVDNINSEPAEGSEVWMMISDSGESLYEMMVRTGRYSGTEEQFLQDYEDAVAAAVSAANNANQAARDVGDAVAAAAAATRNAEAATREANDAAAGASRAKDSATAAAGDADSAAQAALNAALDAGSAADLAREKAALAGAAATAAGEVISDARDATNAATEAAGSANTAAEAANDAAASVTNHTLGVNFNANTGLLKAIYGSHGSILDVELNQETGQIVVTEQID